MSRRNPPRRRNTSSHETLEELRKFVQGSARKIGQGFTSPSDDWTNVLFVQGKKGLAIYGLDGSLFGDEGGKDAIAELLRQLVLKEGAYRYVLLLNAHIRAGGDEAMERFLRGEVRLEQLEGSSELLFLTVGDAESEEFWFAEILRTPAYLRTLGPWRSMTAEGSLMVGRFAGLNEYLRRPRP